MLKTLFMPAAALLLSACATTLAQPLSEDSQTMVDQKPLTIERLFASPSLSGPTPSGVQYSPDGTRVTFLKAREDEANRYDLWQFHVATGEQSMLVDSKLLEPEEVELSEEEKALRERKRIAGRKGIVSYDWGTASTILVPIGGDLHLVTLTESGPEARQLTATDAFEYDAKVSSGGRYVSFIRDGAVYAIDLETSEESRLTPLADPDNAIAYGVAEFVAQEEMSRYTGYWWSGDDRYLAYTKVDESTVDIIPRFDIAAEDVTVINQRYPRAGRPNAIVDLFVRDMDTGEVTEINWRRDDWGPATDQYLTRVNWANNHVFVHRVDRKQKHIEEVAFDMAASSNGAPQNAWRVETQDQFANLSFDRSQRGERVFYSSEESGYRHVYVSEFSGASDTEQNKRALTEGEWAIDQLSYVAGDGGHFFFTGYMDTPLERHLYRHSAGEEGESYDPVLMTEPGKSWSITMAPDGQSFVGTSSSPTQPAQTGLYRTDDGSRITWIEENRLDETHPYAPYLADHTVPEYGTLTAEDGQTLYYSIQLPPDFDPNKTYPALVETYGGPHAQTVNRNWERLSDQFYSRQGYVVFRLDNRGMANRGKRFEDVIYRQTGGPEVRDLLVGVDWLKSQPFVDGDRVGIQGWSYGGYMVMMTILQAPENTFAAAVAGAPVTDWSLYDTFYTERYMDTPQDNPDGYDKSSVFYHLERLETELPNLLLIHGMADDNVTFDNSTRLMAEMQQRGIVFDLMTYPGQRHGIRGQALGTHLMKSRMTFLDRHLKGE
jgi:dipeptidyl-peptidase-4